jgi:hypothetical protein
VSYARWSTDPDDPSDVYVYGLDGWIVADVAYRGLPHDGEDVGSEDPGECADHLERLRSLGYKVPQYAIDELRKEAAERTKETPA